MPKPAASAPPPSLFIRATAPGTGGIATFVLDGWGLASKLQPILRSAKLLRLLEPGELQFGRISDAKGHVIDEVVVAFVPSNETETGFEQIELCCHGGIGAAAAIEEALLKAGFERGTQADLLSRAHLNNKLPLIGLEAKLRLGAAVTARQAEFLLSYRDLQTRWERLGFDAAMGLRTGDLSWRTNTLHAAREAASGFPVAAALLRRHTVVLAGPVNAGKSTLANALARADKHIVSAEPGTTRDRLETRLAIRGLDVTLTDTAGLREAAGEVEREGQRRAKEALESASLRLVVLDGSQPLSDADVALVAQCKALGPTRVLLNKEDLGLDESAAGLGFLLGDEPITLSAQNGTGIDGLEAAIESALLGDTSGSPAAPVGLKSGLAFTLRQKHILSEIQDCIHNGWEDTMTIRAILKLLGTRGNAEQLKSVQAELCT